MIHSFDPILNQETRVLILGSMPGVESLKQQQYYAHKRNGFWPIIFGIYQEELPVSYERKVEFLLTKHLGLWDVLSSCEREGSLDSKIKSEQVNDFAMLFHQYPNIKAVVFNGGKAKDSFKRWVGMNQEIEYYQMPSTSPAYTLLFAEKLKAWEKIKAL